MTACCTLRAYCCGSAQCRLSYGSVRLPADGRTVSTSESMRLCCSDGCAVHRTIIVLQRYYCYVAAMAAQYTAPLLRCSGSVGSARTAMHRAHIALTSVALTSPPYAQVRIYPQYEDAMYNLAHTLSDWAQVRTRRTQRAACNMKRRTLRATYTRAVAEQHSIRCGLAAAMSGSGAQTIRRSSGAYAVCALCVRTGAFQQPETALRGTEGG